MIKELLFYLYLIINSASLSLFVPYQHVYDQKNIRRRVYDALNVLMAMNIISKEKKEIKWIGLPTNSAQECQNLEVGLLVLDFTKVLGISYWTISRATSLNCSVI